MKKNNPFLKLKITSKTNSKFKINVNYCSNWPTNK